MTNKCNSNGGEGVKSVRIILDDDPDPGDVHDKMVRLKEEVTPLVRAHATGAAAPEVPQAFSRDPAPVKPLSVKRHLDIHTANRGESGWTLLFQRPDGSVKGYRLPPTEGTVLIDEATGRLSIVLLHQLLGLLCTANSQGVLTQLVSTEGDPLGDGRYHTLHA